MVRMRIARQFSVKVGQAVPQYREQIRLLANYVAAQQYSLRRHSYLGVERETQPVFFGVSSWLGFALFPICLPICRRSPLLLPETGVFEKDIVRPHYGYVKATIAFSKGTSPKI